MQVRSRSFPESESTYMPLRATTHLALQGQFLTSISATTPSTGLPIAAPSSPIRGCGVCQVLHKQDWHFRSGWFGQTGSD